MIMLYAGKDIMSTSDKLVKVTLDYLYSSIKSPKPEIASRIRQLRITRDIDRKRYSQMKRHLPYIICGSFNPPYRKTENFGYTEYFIMDIDHISDKGLSLTDLRQMIEKDNRVVMSFISPSEDGLKVLFRLKERCYDSGIYSLFYKVFTRKFASQYNLEQVIDSQTSDVCRACFISMDPDIFFNQDAECIDLNSVLNTDDTQSMLDLQASVKKKETKTTDNNNVNSTVPSEPEADSIERIKEILKLSKPKPVKKDVYIPQELDEIIDNLTHYIEASGIKVSSVDNISYGKKIKMAIGLKLSEVNLFYGKKGFTAVISPRGGTNAELNALSRDLIESFINQIS